MKTIRAQKAELREVVRADNLRFQTSRRLLKAWNRQPWFQDGRSEDITIRFEELET